LIGFGQIWAHIQVCVAKKMGKGLNGLFW
jgi:hypothetical protein